MSLRQKQKKLKKLEKQRAMIIEIIASHAGSISTTARSSYSVDDTNLSLKMSGQDLAKSADGLAAVSQAIDELTKEIETEEKMKRGSEIEVSCDDIISQLDPSTEAHSDDEVTANQMHANQMHANQESVSEIYDRMLDESLCTPGCIIL